MTLNENGQNILVLKQAADLVYSDNTVLRDLSMTQAILEGACLKAPPSSLALEYNNLFGIKGSGTNGSIELMTNEWNSKTHKMDRLPQKFACNLSLEDSFKQHRRLMLKPRYAKLWECKTLEDAAREIRLSGYATDPAYTNLLINTYVHHVKGK